MDSGTMAKICSRISPVRAQLSTPACIPGPVSTEHWVLSLTAPQLLASPGFWSFSLQHYGQRKRLTNFCSLLPLLPLVYGRSIWVMDPRPCPHDPNIRKDEQSSILNFKLLWDKGYPSSFTQTRKAGSDGGKLKTMQILTVICHSVAWYVRIWDCNKGEILAGDINLELLTYKC